MLAPIPPPFEHGNYCILFLMVSDRHIHLAAAQKSWPRPCPWRKEPSTHRIGTAYAWVVDQPRLALQSITSARFPIELRCSLALSVTLRSVRPAGSVASLYISSRDAGGEVCNLAEADRIGNSLRCIRTAETWAFARTIRLKRFHTNLGSRHAPSGEFINGEKF